jgi:hypothetical protein
VLHTASDRTMRRLWRTQLRAHGLAESALLRTAVRHVRDAAPPAEAEADQSIQITLYVVRVQSLPHPASKSRTCG